METVWVRRLGIASLMGCLLQLFVTPLMAAGYWLKGGDPGGAPPAFAEAMMEMFQPLLSFDSPVAVYQTWGMLLLPMTLLLLGGLVAAHAAQSGVSKFETGTYWVTLVGVVLLNLSVLGSYYVAPLVGSAVLFDLAFIGAAVPGMLLSQMGFLLYGIATWKGGTFGKTSAVLLMLGGMPGGLVFGQVVIGHFSGILLIGNIAIATMCYQILTGRHRSARLAA